MKLSDIEFRAMDSWWHRWGQENFEVPLFERMGLDIRNKDVLEIGCGNGHGAYLINQRAPRGVDLKLFDFLFRWGIRTRILALIEWKNI